MLQIPISINDLKAELLSKAELCVAHITRENNIQESGVCVNYAQKMNFKEYNSFSDKIKYLCISCIKIFC